MKYEKTCILFKKSKKKKKKHEICKTNIETKFNHHDI